MALNRLDRLARGDTPNQGDLEWGDLRKHRRMSRLPSFVNVLRRDFQRPALVEAAAQIVAPLEPLNVFVNGRERCHIQAVSEFFIAGTVSVLLDEIGNEVENLFLTLGKGHNLLWAKKRGNSKRGVSFVDSRCLRINVCRRVRTKA